MRANGLWFTAAAILLFATSACNGGPSTTALPSSVPSDTGAQVESAAGTAPADTLYVGSEATQIIPQPPGIAPIVLDAGPIMQIFNTANGTEREASTGYVGLTTFGVSADQTQVIMGGEADGFQGSFNDGIEAYSLALNRSTGFFFDSGSQVQTASAFSGDNSKMYFADGSDAVYGYNVATKAALGPFAVPNFGGVASSINTATGISVNENGSTFYVVNNPSRTGPSAIEVYDVAAQAVTTKIALSTPSLVLRSDWTGGRIYALSSTTPRIFIINASTKKLEGYVYESGGVASTFELNRAGTRLYAASGRHITVYAMDTACRCGVADAHFTVQYPIDDMKLNLAGTHLYVAPSATLQNNQPAPVLELDAATGSILRSFPGPKNTPNSFTTSLVAIAVR